jgi:hypothetical protein
MESVVLDISAELRPPAPAPRAETLGPFLCMLARIPFEAWTEAYFEQAVVASELSIGRAVVASDPAAIRRVLLENCDNSEKDLDPLTVEDRNRRTPHSKTI